MRGTGDHDSDGRHGLAWAAAIGGSWLAVHFAGIFAWDLTWASAPLIALIVLLQAWLSTGLFIIAHDCMHGSLAPGRPWLNKAVGTLCLGAYAGLSYAALRPQHHAHHAAPGTGADPDFHEAEPSRLLPWFFAFFRNYYTHGQIARITLAAVVYLLFGAELLNIAVFWALPALLALVQLFVFGTYLPHRHDGEAFADRHRARSSTLQPLLSLLTCFHFGAYHHEHHLSPGTPWFRLPAFRRARAERR